MVDDYLSTNRIPKAKKQRKTARKAIEAHRTHTAEIHHHNSKVQETADGKDFHSKRLKSQIDRLDRKATRVSDRHSS